MKLISERIDQDSYEMVSEAIEGTHQKHWYLRGVFGEAELVNKNRRKYPSGVMNEAVEKFQPLLQTQDKVLGEYHHPKSPLVNSLNACIQIQKLYMQGNKMMGEAKVLRGTQYGNHLIGLLENGINRPVSTRALGDVTKKNDYNLVNEMTLITVDVVDNQSCQTATPDCIYEDVDWMLDLGSITDVDADILTTVKKNSDAQSFRNVMKDVNNFILEGMDDAVQKALTKLKFSSR